MMQWKTPLAIGNYRLWATLLGSPQILSGVAGGYAKWSTMAGKTFLGRPVPFSSVCVYDRAQKTIVVTLPLPLSADATTRMHKADIDLLSYDDAARSAVLSNDNLVGLVALLTLTQEIQLGSLASNAVFGAYITLAQGLRTNGQPDMGKIRALYQQWYDRLNTNGSSASMSTQERFSLGLPRRERLGSVSELVSAQRHYDRLSGDGLLQQERMTSQPDPLAATIGAAVAPQLAGGQTLTFDQTISNEMNGYDFGGRNTQQARTPHPNSTNPSSAPNATRAAGMAFHHPGNAGGFPRTERMAPRSPAPSTGPAPASLSSVYNTLLTPPAATAPRNERLVNGRRRAQVPSLADSVYNSFLTPPTPGSPRERLTVAVESNLQNLLNS